MTAIEKAKEAAAKRLQGLSNVRSEETLAKDIDFDNALAYVEFEKLYGAPYFDLEEFKKKDGTGTVEIWVFKTPKGVKGDCSMPVSEALDEGDKLSKSNTQFFKDRGTWKIGFTGNAGKVISTISNESAFED